MYSQTCLLPVAVQRQQIENCMVPEPHPCTPTVHTRPLLMWSSPLPSHTYSHIGEKQSQLKTPGALIPLLKQKQLSCTGTLPCAIAGRLAGSCRRDREPSPALCDGLEVWNGGGGRLKNKGIYIYTTMSNSC